MAAMDLRYEVSWKVDKSRDGEVYDTIEGTGNMLVHGGASALWDLFIGAATVDPFDNTNAYIGVGTSAVATTAEMTDLQGTVYRQGMDVTYPLHTDGTEDEASRSVVFVATFDNADANFAWNEWGLFNASTLGRMLNRKVTTLGTKTADDSWVFTVTFTFPA